MPSPAPAPLPSLDSHPDPIWVFDRRTLRFLWVNPAAVTDLGYSRDALLAMTLAGLCPAEGAGRLRDAVARLGPDAEDAGVWRFRRASGAGVDASVRWRAVAFDHAEAVLAALRDVTDLVAPERERVQAFQVEQRSRHAAEAAALLFRSIFEAVPGKFLVLTPNDFQIVAASDAYLAATMTRREDIEGRRMLDVFPDLPDRSNAEGVLRLRASLERVRAEGATDVMGVLRYPIPRPAARGGSFEERFWNPVNAPLKAPDGTLAFIIHRIEDVTEFVRANGNGDAAALARNGEATAPLALDVVLRSQELRADNRRLQAQEAGLRTAQRLLGLGLWTLDLATGVLRWSDNLYAMFGVDPASFGHSLDAYVALVHPDDRNAAAERYRAFIASDEPHLAFEHRIVRPDGGVIRVHGVAERSGTAQSRLLTGVVQDVTQQAALRARTEGLSQRLLDTLENISDAFVTLDRAWRFTFVNTQAERLLRRSRAELVGTVVWDALPETVGSTFQREFERAAATRGTARFTEFYPPLGAWFEVAAYRTADGLAIYLHDVTERRRAEAALRISDERFRLVARATNDVVWDWDLRAGTVWWNDGLSTLFGHDPATVEPGPESWSNRIHPEDRERVLARIHAAIDGTATDWQDEYRFLHADGGAHTVVDCGFIIRDGTGRAVRMVGVMADVTERRELEQRLRQSQKMEAIGQLTGGVAHDFNNLLTVILGNAELLSERLADPELRELATLSATAAERAAELTHTLLAIARRQALSPRIVDVNGLVAGMDAMLRRTLTENISIRTVCAEGLWLAEIDPGQLEVALLNLAINARDAMPEGGGLTIETANAMLDETYCTTQDDVAPGEYVAVAVTDTGMGMTKEVAARAFEPFFTTKGVGKGTGLGLAMVYGFVKQSGGHVRIYSEPGEGTTIRLYLPRAKAAGAQPTPLEAEASVVGGTECILVVEDETLVREHLIAQLRGLGYRVVGAETGRGALEVLERTAEIDLLLTDIVMPGGMNGRQLAEAATRLKPGLKVLFTSGYSENAIVHHGRLDPGVHLLGKPYRRQELARKVRAVLDGP